ncbi:MAG: Spy/CpxP family protein refolding chaperone [bacterium]
MSRLATSIALMGALTIASVAHAQQQDRGMGPPPRGGLGGAPAGSPIGAPQRDLASELLAQTGELKLTDQQVTRLAAIARRSADRRQSLRKSVDSMFASRQSPPPAGPGSSRRFAPSAEQLATLQKMRDQSHADLRDAISVLTADQQATAWEGMGRRGGGGRRMGMFGGGVGGGMSRGMMPRRSGMPRSRSPQPPPAPAER